VRNSISAECLSLKSNRLSGKGSLGERGAEASSWQRNKMAAFATAALATISVLGVGRAMADATWVGTNSHNANDTTNWSASPSGQTLIINTTANAGAYPIIGSDLSFTPVDVRIGTGAAGRLDQVAGLAGTGNGNWLYVGYSGATSIFNLADTSGNGGTLTGYAQGTGSFNVGGTAQSGTMYVGLDNNTTSTVNINTTGTLAGGTMYVGGAGSSSGTVNLDSGTVKFTTLEIAGRPFNNPANGGASSFNMSGGTVNISGSTYVAPSTRNTTAQNGTLSIQGGTFNDENDFVTGLAGAATATANVSLTGGTLNIASTTKRWMVIGMYDFVNSNITVDGGKLNLNTNTDVRFSTSGNTGANVFTLKSGAVTSYGDNAHTANGTGVLDLDRSGATGNNSTFNLNGGTLTIYDVETFSNTGAAVMNFNGGTLRATGANAHFVELGGTSQRANVRNGGAVIDSNGFDVTAVESLLHSNVNGDNAVDGGLTKNGNGTLTLAGTNTYTGNTTINAGTVDLASTGSLKFAIGANGVNNKITGGGAAMLEGALNIDLTNAGTATGNAWTLVDVASPTYALTFAIAGFTNQGSGLWRATANNADYQFSQTTGVLSVVPEPASVAGLAIVTGGLLRRRRRK
jgi:autotransporter-associated beta strand protein